MNLLFYAIGVLIIFLAKLLIHNKADEPIEKWRRFFEIPSDLSMLSFMMGIAGTASLQNYTRENQIILVILIGIGMVSIAIFKQNCGTISNKGGITQFEKPILCGFLFALNIAFSITSIFLSYRFLGANSS